MSHLKTDVNLGLRSILWLLGFGGHSGCKSLGYGAWMVLCTGLSILGTGVCRCFGDLI